MILELKDKIIIGLILLIIGNFFYNDYKNSQLEKEKLDLTNQIALKDSLIKEKDGAYTRLSMQYNSQKELILELKNDSIFSAKELKKMKEEIAYLLTIKIKPDTIYVDSTKTIVKNSVAKFNGYSRPYTVSGEFHLSDSTTRKLSVLMDEFKLSILESKLENGFYRARVKFVDLNNKSLDMFQIIDLQSAVNIDDINNKEPNFLSIGAGGEIGLNEFKLGILLNLYDKNIFLLNYQLNEHKTIDFRWQNQISVAYYRVLF